MTANPRGGQEQENGAAGSERGGALGTDENAPNKPLQVSCNLRPTQGQSKEAGTEVGEEEEWQRIQGASRRERTERREVSGAEHKELMKVFQIKLNRCRAAHDLLEVKARKQEAGTEAEEEEWQRIQGAGRRERTERREVSGTEHKERMKVFQIYLNKCHAAHDLLKVKAR